MVYKADQDMAMILPLPVSSHDEHTTIRFITLDGYKSFFDDILSGFPTLQHKQIKSFYRSASKRLKVHEVGDYDASFIPTLNDFDRLDPQFKLSRQAWDRLPEYQAYGFAVFKLRVTTHNQQRYMSATENNPYADRLSKLHRFSRLKRPHPMAFEFVTRLPEKLFFPTIHIHDEEVHENANFDHHLYYQSHSSSNALSFTKTALSKKTTSEFMNVKKTMGIVDGQQRCHAVVMTGRFPNQDTVLAIV